MVPIFVNYSVLFYGYPYTIIESSNETQQQRKQERPDEAIGRFTSNMVVMLIDVSDRVNAE